MDHFTRSFTRRDFLAALTAGAALRVFPEEALRWIEDGGFAQELVRTPAQTEGPFYPDRLPLDTDNDLVVIGKDASPALGEVTHLGGRVLDARGEPVRGALVEIWQVDNNGAYLHSQSGNRERRDTRFQGYGKFETASDGAYKFRTIKPVSYPGRTPHIHVKVSKGRRELLTTQCYIKGHPQNERDGVLRGIGNAAQRASVQVPFEPLKDSKVGELLARFEIVLGFTPVA
jgi:protocatechuate 3,4-dioxygenase beta subunit